MLYQSLKLTNGIWVLAELKIQPPNPNFVVIIICCAVFHSEKCVRVFVIFFLIRKLYPHCLYKKYFLLMIMMENSMSFDKRKISHFKVHCHWVKGK